MKISSETGGFIKFVDPGERAPPLSEEDAQKIKKAYEKHKQQQKEETESLKRPLLLFARLKHSIQDFFWKINHK